MRLNLLVIYFVKKWLGHGHTSCTGFYGFVTWLIFACLAYHHQVTQLCRRIIFSCKDTCHCFCFHGKNLIPKYPFNSVSNYVHTCIQCCCILRMQLFHVLVLNNHDFPPLCTIRLEPLHFAWQYRFNRPKQIETIDSNCTYKINRGYLGTAHHRLIIKGTYQSDTCTNTEIILSLQI